MSAAEKLRALETESREDHGGDSGPYSIAHNNVAYDLLNALPQIVALVEAAEQGAADGANTCECFACTRLREIGAALAALDEKLGAVT